MDTGGNEKPAKTQGEVMIHIFEEAGLGTAPFRHDRYVRDRGACAYCGTALGRQFWLVGKDGRRFYVGSECIKKSGDRGLIAWVSAEEKRERAEKAAEKRRKAEEAYRAEQERQFPGFAAAYEAWCAAITNWREHEINAYADVRVLLREHGEVLATVPHPKMRGKNFKQYVDFCLENGYGGLNFYRMVVGKIQEHVPEVPRFVWQDEQPPQPFKEDFRRKADAELAVTA